MKLFLEDNYTSYVHNENRTKCRGIVHKIAFYMSVILLLISDGSIPTFIYFVTQLMQYGVSSIFHLTQWKNLSNKLLCRKIDQSCIFLLCAGHYTGAWIFMNHDISLGYFYIHWYTELLYIIWFLATMGIVKIIVIKYNCKLIDVSLYCCMGLPIFLYSPFIWKQLPFLSCILWWSSGFFYILGSLIYYYDFPGRVYNILDSHDLFHICTVLGQLCYILPFHLKYTSL